MKDDDKKEIYEVMKIAEGVDTKEKEQEMNDKVWELAGSRQGFEFAISCVRSVAQTIRVRALQVAERHKEHMKSDPELKKETPERLKLLDLAVDHIIKGIEQGADVADHIGADMYRLMKERDDEA